MWHEIKQFHLFSDLLFIGPVFLKNDELMKDSSFVETTTCLKANGFNLCLKCEIINISWHCSNNAICVHVQNNSYIISLKSEEFYFGG